MPVARLLDCGMLYADVLALQTATKRDGAWDVIAEGLGDAHLTRANEQMAAGHSISAAASMKAASAAYNFAQMPLQDGDRKRELYAKVAKAFGALSGLPGNQVARAEIEFAGTTMVGWTVSPVGANIGAVVVFGGQSGWGPCYARAADALAARGIATVLAEGPGQGETRLFGGLHLNVDVPAAYSRFVDVAVQLSDTGRVGIWGNSMGGLFAALTAAEDRRISACCVNSGFAAPRLLEFRAFREQAAAMLGDDDPVAIQENFDRLAFDPARHRIAGDLLLLHGGADALVDLDDLRPFASGADPDRVTVNIWPDGDHTVYNHGDERNALVADWFGDRFVH